jgi:phage/plasmid-associated DNA primase
VVPDDQKNPHLLEELMEEASGIFNWMLSGLRKWNAGEKLDDARTPAICLAAKEVYVAENDTIGEFIDEILAKDASNSIRKDELYRYYNWWTEANGRHPLSKNNLSRKLIAKGWTEPAGGKEKGQRVWLGWRLKVHARTNNYGKFEEFLDLPEPVATQPTVVDPVMTEPEFLQQLRLIPIPT